MRFYLNTVEISRVWDNVIPFKHALSKNPEYIRLISLDSRNSELHECDLNNPLRPLKREY